MPPVYVWLDKNSEKEIEVIRTFDEYQVPPTQEESTLTEEEYKAAKWEKLISSKVMVTKSGNWGPGKGHWLYLFIFIGLSFTSKVLLG